MSGNPTSSSSASASLRSPIEQPSTVPGKRCWVIPVVSRVKDPLLGEKEHIVASPVFEIDPHYQPIKAIGRGAYGVVCSAVDLRTGEKVAIKKIINAFSNFTDAIRTLREVKLLRVIRHENVITVRDVMLPANGTEFNDLYVVYDLMDTDLNQVIRSPQVLSDDHTKYFVYQLLRGMKFLHSAAILHRDIKPHNLLLSATCDLKICDFGLARTMADPGLEKFMTEYVQTRWYRAPELLLGCDNYSTPIDLWSVGCILGELLGRRPMFPGKDWEDTLRLILETCPVDAEQDLGFINNQRMRDFLANQIRNTQVTGYRFPVAEKNPLAVDLLNKLLVFDPRRRATVQEALQHPYLQQLHDDRKEPVAGGHFVFDFRDEEVTETSIRAFIIQEIQRYQAQNLAHQQLLALQQAQAQAARMSGDGAAQFMFQQAQAQAMMGAPAPPAQVHPAAEAPQGPPFQPSSHAGGIAEPESAMSNATSV